MKKEIVTTLKKIVGLLVFGVFTGSNYLFTALNQVVELQNDFTKKCKIYKKNK